MSNLCMRIHRKFEQKGPWKSLSETSYLTRMKTIHHKAIYLVDTQLRTQVT